MDYRYDNRHEYNLKNACEEYGFIAPPHFWRQSNKRLLNFWNGIGSEGDWFNLFIPETIYFINVSLASLVHDEMFALGVGRKEFHLANLYFLYNMNQIIKRHSLNELTKTLRYLRSNKYYIAVESDAGWEAYIKGKPYEIRF